VARFFCVSSTRLHNPEFCVLQRLIKSVKDVEAPRQLLNFFFLMKINHKITFGLLISRNDTLCRESVLLV